MAVNVYEGLFIFDSGRYSRDPSGVPSQVEKAVAEAGGEMLASRLWEERRLAYPIKGNRKGTYWLTYFRLDGRKLPPMNRQFQISDSVLRHMVVQVDPRLVEALVSHATATPETKAPAAGKPTEAKPTEAKATEAKATEAKATGEKPAETKPAGEKPAEGAKEGAEPETTAAGAGEEAS